MNEFIDFLSLSEPNVRFVVLSSVLLGIAASSVGVFAFLRRNTLVGETVAHSMLPGIGLAFILSGSREPIFLVSGAIVAGWVSVLFMEWISKKGPMKKDLALAITLTGFFGIGILLMTHIQRGSYGDHSGLDHYIFGNVAAMTKQDTWVFGGLAVLVLLILGASYKELTVFSFNPEFAQSNGLPTRLLEVGLSTITILAIAAGIKAVGIVLMAALLIIPAAASRYWMNRLKGMLVLSAVFGALAAILGAFVSYKYSGMPTGPLIVVVLALLTALSVLFAPRMGMLSKRLKKYRRAQKMRAENFVKEVYQLSEQENDFDRVFSLLDVANEFGYKRSEAFRSMRLAVAYRWVLPKMEGVRLTAKGKEKGHEVNRLHRLWEIYLARKANTPLRYVHETAEVMEHILTPELEQEIMEELGLCENFDPKSEIHQTVK
jgi:manganese/zinc/iron transport system permease protein